MLNWFDHLLFHTSASRLYLRVILFKCNYWLIFCSLLSGESNRKRPMNKQMSPKMNKRQTLSKNLSALLSGSPSVEEKPLIKIDSKAYGYGLKETRIHAMGYPGKRGIPDALGILDICVKTRSGRKTIGNIQQFECEACLGVGLRCACCALPVGGGNSNSGSLFGGSLFVPFMFRTRVWEFIVWRKQQQWE